MSLKSAWAWIAHSITLHWKGNKASNFVLKYKFIFNGFCTKCSFKNWEGAWHRRSLIKGKHSVIERFLHFLNKHFQLIWCIFDEIFLLFPINCTQNSESILLTLASLILWLKVRSVYKFKLTKIGKHKLLLGGDMAPPPHPLQPARGLTYVFDQMYLWESVADP